MAWLRDLIFSKLSKNEVGVEDQIFDIHHLIMKEYGWIPLEEFKNLPMQTVNNLIAAINRDRKKQNKEMKKSSKGR